LADIEEVYVHNLYKKHNGKEIFKGFYTLEKKTYQDDGEVINEGFGFDRETLEILRARIMAILIDESPTKDKKSSNNNSPKKSRQTRP
jgi:hypothetical protein